VAGARANAAHDYADRGVPRLRRALQRCAWHHADFRGKPFPYPAVLEWLELAGHVEPVTTWLSGSKWVIGWRLTANGLALWRNLRTIPAHRALIVRDPNATALVPVSFFDPTAQKGEPNVKAETELKPLPFRGNTIHENRIPTQDISRWVWSCPRGNKLAELTRQSDEYIVRVFEKACSFTGHGCTAHEAYQNALRQQRKTRMDVKQLLREHAKSIKAKAARDGSQDQQINDLREGLQEVRRALAGTTIASGQPLHRRVAAVVDKMFQLDRTASREKRRAEQLARGQERSHQVIRQLLTLLAAGSGSDSPEYIKALELARTVGVTPVQEVHA